MLAWLLAMALSANQSSPSLSPGAENWLSSIPPVPEFSAPRSRRLWEKQRETLRGDLQSLLGKLPPRPRKLSVQTLSREDRGAYIVEKFEFDNGAASRVPGYLLLPKTSGRHPAILYCHWHGGQYDVGKEELFRTNAVPIPPGPRLAQLGYVVIAIDAYCFGERNGRGPAGLSEKGSAGELSASKFNLWAGRTLWGMILRDDMIALDYLVTRPEVDSSKIGVTGISMGATRSWWLMALDQRIHAGVAVACLTRYQNLIEDGMLKAHGIYYFVPGILNHFDTEAIVALAAPRPLLCMTGDSDSGSPVEGVRTIGEKVAEIYQLTGAPANFRNEIFPGVGHVYLPDMWKKTEAWLQQHLPPPAQ